MAAAPRPRGRLPRRVYWTRRLLVLAVALAVVLGLVQLVRGFAPDDAPAERAATSSGTTRPTPRAMPTYGPVAVRGLTPKQRKQAVQAAPTGECRADEISVLPVVDTAEAGGRIPIRLDLQGTQPACTFEVSAASLVVKVVTDDGTRFWSTQDCGRGVPKSDVVVRSAQPTSVTVTWSGRASDPDCTDQPAWALPGFYEVYAAAAGSSPTDVPFEVTRPSVRYVTETPSPTATPSATSSGTAKPRRTPSPSPSASPTR
ncbi:hypothetical protein [Nocardioides aurantiacus]|uniref:Uncharacterized protein n=1 Tax=Nocardioides aurantiacus TaxID=86796 RepID=A0A3N2CPX1_9ACTN|nr:hypothetical protein [Nocardioides aurantiacus]ROR89466.1 hypothetical protein EDD33_0291 [Nocardioides aurantiacus]